VRISRLPSVPSAIVLIGKGPPESVALRSAPGSVAPAVIGEDGWVVVAMAV
jgi:hypothetical protein